MRLSPAKIRVVYFKEMKDMLRDRRTLLSTIIIPMLLFPLMTIGMGMLAVKMVQKAQKESMKIMLRGAEHAPKLAESLRKTEGLIVEPAAKDYVARINDKQLRAVVEFPPGFETALHSQTNAALQLKIFHYAAEMRSQMAVQAVRKVVNEYRDQVVGSRLEQHGLSKQVIRPFETVEENVASAKKVGGNLLGGMVPYMIILLCLIGATHPAIDLTAGEKERGTMETLLASPVSREEIVLGKFLMVVTASVMTAIISLISMGATFSLPFLAVREMTRTPKGLLALDLSLGGIVAVLFMVLPLAVMFSAVLMTVSTAAKSFKEAQSYVSPLMIVAILPAVAVLLPGMDLNTRLALVPILNISLVSKELLMGNYPWGYIALAFGSSCAYAAATLALAVMMFKRESVLFRS